MRDWIIDCAVRWQRRNKLVVARPMGSDDVPAAIGPRDAALKPFLATPAEADAPEDSAIALAAEPEVPSHAEAPIEQTLTIPMPTPAEEGEAAPEPETAEAVDPAADGEPVEETPAEEAPIEALDAPALETESDIPADEPAPVPSGAIERRSPSVPTSAIAAESVVPAVDAAPARLVIELGDMTDWQVLVLSGPAGSGKSSIAQHFCEILPRSVHIKVEPLRDRAFSVLVARPFGASAQDATAMPEVWSGPTEEARQQAADLGLAYSHTGHHVIIDDVIESPADLQLYQDGLAERRVRIVSLMPGLDELERRDKMRPVDQQHGTRLKEFHANMVRQLGAHSAVLDISQETAPETVQRIVGLLQPQA